MRLGGKSLLASQGKKIHNIPYQQISRLMMHICHPNLHEKLRSGGLWFGGKTPSQLKKKQAWWYVPFNPPIAGSIK
jgi:hypothetical protein